MAGFADFFNRTRRVLGEVFYGMAAYEIERSHRRSRGALEHIFILITFGDIVGVPVLPPYYSLRVLPFVVPLINNWRRRMLRERDLLDTMF